VNLWLFDLDGVLIRPGGYRESLRRTVAHFSRLAGYADRPLEESTIEAFEAQGITCEWDIAGICILADIFTLWRADPALHLPDDLESCWERLRADDRTRPEPDYADWARRIGAFGGGSPAASAMKFFLQEVGRANPDPERLGELENVINLLLAHPREFARSPVMRHFQQYTLGSRAYADHYRVQPEIETPSLLAELDRPAVSVQSRDRILELHRGKRITAAVITARPCRPQNIADDPTDYPPEAEIALRIIGLKDLPLAGAGHMQWLARRHGQLIDAYLKPSPVHSLAAFALALGDGEGTALESARAFVEEGKLLPPLDRLRAEPADILIFEDSPTGVVGTQSAVDLLIRARCPCRLSILGVAAGGEKRAVLESLGAKVFETTDEAMAFGWKNFS
jgi:hypothetical protein